MIHEQVNVNSSLNKKLFPKKHGNSFFGSLFSFLFLLAAIVMFFCLLYFYDDFLISIYGFLLFVSISFFAIANQFKLLSINSLFVVLSFGFLIGPIVYYNQEGFSFTAAFSLLGAFYCYLVSLFFCERLRWRRPKKKKHPSFHFNERFVIFLFFFFGLLGALFYLYKNSFSSAFVESSRVEQISGSGIVLSMIKSLIVSSGLLLILAMNKRVPFSLFLIVSSISCIACLVIGYRSPSFELIALCLLLFVARKGISLRKMLLIVFLLVVFATTIGLFRAGSGNFFQKMLLDYTVTYINYQRVLSWFPSITPFQGGYTYLINFIMLKPGPDLDFTLWLKETMNLTFSGGGVTPTIFGELYINFGFFGMFLGSFLLGGLSEAMERLFLQKSDYWYGCLIPLFFALSGGCGLANIEIDLLVLCFVGFSFDVLTGFKGRINKRLVCTLEHNNG